ncbi:MAG: SCO1664 family protein [Acidimicrobiales bacterium]
MPWSSNGTFLVSLAFEGADHHAIYKPHRGERPLWDFPDGLFLREVAAYELSAALGWDIIPETVLREDAPLGVGSLQWFVDADFAQHYFTLIDDVRWHDDLRRLAVFDLIANNADRKSGHCLVADDRIWGIDNGLCFHVEPKLRTVIWEFGDEEIPSALRADAARFAAAPPASLDGLLNASELGVLSSRAAAVSELERFPDPGPDRRPYPWPLV